MGEEAEVSLWCSKCEECRTPTGREVSDKPLGYRAWSPEGPLLSGGPWFGHNRWQSSLGGAATEEELLPPQRGCPPEWGGRYVKKGVETTGQGGDPGEAWQEGEIKRKEGQGESPKEGEDERKKPQ